MADTKSKSKDKKNNKKGNLVWVDMEMTGLDPKRENIIEIASIVTDDQLNILAEGPNIIVHQGEKLLDRMDTWNKSHHGKSGLLEEVRNSKVTVKKAEQDTLEFLRIYCEAGKAPLCGNSVHHDRKFIDKYMPDLGQFLHYRHIDVSSLKALVKAWYPTGENKFKKKSSHRALDDIRESIEELKFFRKAYFRTTAKLPKDRSQVE